MTPDIAYGSLAPLLVVFGAGIISVLVEAFVPARYRYGTQMVVYLGGLAAALVSVVLLAGTRIVTAEGSVAVDGPALFLQGVTVIVAIGAGLLIGERTVIPSASRRKVLAGFAPQAAVAPGGSGERDAERAGFTQTEVFPLALFATGGLLLFPAANDLITLFIALEVLSLPLYVLCGMARRRRLLSQEAAVKYFLLGSFSSAFFVYGIALVYGYAGTVDFRGIADVVEAEGPSSLILIGIAMMSVGLLFKVGAVPFHTWTPDVYQGAPTSITAFMAAGTKVAAFGAILRLFYTAVPGLEADWVPVLWVIAALTMIVGTVVGVAQNDVKRMLAYSSVAHAGFLLTGMMGSPTAGLTAMLFYLAAYAVSTVGVFAVAGLVRDAEGAEISDLRAWSGLGRRQPLVAGAFAVLLLALAGIPLTSGFIAKFAVFSAAVAGGAVTLVLIGVLTSAIAASFYVRVIVVMFFRDADAGGSSVGGSGVGGSGSGGAGSGGADAGGSAVAFARQPVTLAVVGVAAVVTVVLGIAPQPLLDLAEAASTFAW
ncbi:MAG: NADH-quinone oxidoreductase subunit NuoN [Dietzia psychralcaliphila]